VKTLGKNGKRQSILKRHENIKNVNKVLTYAVMLDSLVVAYIQFQIILIELKKVLSQKLKCLCSKTTILSE